MRVTRSTAFLTVFVTAGLLAGCGSSGVGDIFGDRRDTGGTYENLENVRGTVERVDTRDRFIVLDRDDYRTNLRNEDEGEVVLYYDDRTTVEYRGSTYRPQDLERGDRILADVDQVGSRLMAEEIEVLYDATAGGTRGDTLGDLDDELRGTVRYVDTRDRTLEIEPSSSSQYGSRSDVVVVHYDAQTTVEFQGRRYQPENLERGDLVEVELRSSGGRLLAEDILVVQDARSSTGR